MLSKVSFRTESDSVNIKPHLVDFNDRLEKASTYLKGREDIAFAYLFGSLAEGTGTHLSDIDIAVFVIDVKPAEVRLEILGDLIDIFQSDHLDLVLLNTAPLGLKMRVIQPRKILADNIPHLRHRFESHVLRSYFDFSKIEERILKNRQLTIKSCAKSTRNFL